jgi:transposase-like protein
MIIALAAVQADFKQFEWMSNKGPMFELKLDADLPLKVETDDLIGLRKATRGPTAGAYQVVLAKYPQKIFRSIKQEKIDEFIKHLKPYQGIPEKPAKTGQRQGQLRKQHLETGDKQTAQYFVARGTINEAVSYDRANYQWRKMVRTVNVVTKHHGTTRSSLHDGDVVGLRYMRKSHGGYVIMQNGERVNIDHDVYEKITLNSDILPSAQQQRGLVDLKDLIATLPKRARRPQIRIPKEIKPGRVKIPMVKESQHDPDKFVDRTKPLVSDFHYKDLEEEMDFDEEEEDNLLNPPDEFEMEDLDTVNTQGKPAITPLEDEDEFDEEDDPEMDFHQDHDIDEETGEELPEPDAILAEEGVVLASKDGTEWTVVSIEPTGMTDVLVMFNADKKSLRHYKVPAGEDLRSMKSVTYVKTIKGKALDKVMEQAADLDLTAGKRL